MYKSLLIYSAMFALPMLFTGCKDSTSGPDRPEATTGTLEVTTTTSGSDQDADGYVITVDEVTEQPADTTDNITFEKLPEGSHTIQLSGTAPNCTVKESSQTVDISAGKTSSANFRISCKAALINKIVFVGTQEGQPNLYVADPGTLPELDPFGLAVDKLHKSHPDVFPDGTKVAYEAGGNIWTVNADGKGATQLTDSGQDNHPSVFEGKGGTKIAFTSRRDGKSQLYIMNANGLEQTHIETENPLYEAEARGGKNQLAENKWNDGTIGNSMADIQLTALPLFVARTASGAEAEIVIVDPKASNGKRVKQLTKNDHYDGQPSWSPDGTELIILTENKKGIKNLRVLDAKTGEDKGTTDFRPGFLDEQAYPGWSPDGKELLFTSVAQSKAKIAGPQLKAQDYNSSRSNKPSPLVDVVVDTDETKYSAKHAVWSPVF